MVNGLRLAVAALLYVAAWGGFVRADEADESAAGAIEAECARNQELYAGDSNVLVRAGLVAYRAERRVVVTAEATGLGEWETAEFFLVGPGSSHGYEALAMSHARAGDIHEALEFIGMKPGWPVDTDAFRFWPKGERVIVSLAAQGGTNVVSPVRAERLIWDKNRNQPLRESGFIFVGSTMVDDTERPGERVYAADAMDPRSIASNYNERQTVLDVPRQAPQGDVYEKQAVNGAFVMKKGTRVRVELRPEYADGKMRVTDVEAVVHAAVTPALALEHLAFDLRWGGQSTTNAGLNAALALFSDLVAEGRDPYVTLAFDDGLTLQAVHDLCQLLSSIETETGIRVEPPPAGRPYYRAHVPNESFRERSGRRAQPWELRLKSGEGGVVAALATRIEQIWHDDRIRPELRIEDMPAATPEAFRVLLDANPGIPVLLVFADPTIRYADLLTFVSPVLATHPAVHVFLGEPKD